MSLCCLRGRFHDEDRRGFGGRVSSPPLQCPFHRDCPRRMRRIQFHIVLFDVLYVDSCLVRYNAAPAVLRVAIVRVLAKGK